MTPEHTISFDEQQWRTRLRQGGLRATEPRLAVLRILAGAASPLTAQVVLGASRTAALDRVTVYRTLTSLVRSGLAHRLDTGDRVWRYGLSEAADHRHAHLVCDECGTVRCAGDATLNVSFKGRAGVEKFRVKQHDVYLHGTCEDCEEPPGAAKHQNNKVQSGKSRTNRWTKRRTVERK